MRLMKPQQGRSSEFRATVPKLFTDMQPKVQDVFNTLPSLPGSGVLPGTGTHTEPTAHGTGPCEPAPQQGAAARRALPLGGVESPSQAHSPRRLRPPSLLDEQFLYGYFLTRVSQTVPTNLAQTSHLKFPKKRHFSPWG